MGVSPVRVTGLTAHLLTRARRPRLAEAAFAGLLIGPDLLAILALSLFPLLALCALSFFSLDLASPHRTGWVGPENYRRLLDDGRFWHALQITALYTFSTVALQLALGLGLALLLFERFPGEAIVRTLVLLPMILAPVVVGLLWRTLLLTPRFGFVDYLFEVSGLGSRPWLSEPTYALVSVILMHTWQWTPFAFLVFLASLHALPTEPLEAAKIDCQSWWQELWYILLPLLRPAIALVAIFRTVTALNAFDAIYAATGGGPGTATEILNLYVFYVAFVHLSVGYGASLGVVQLLLALGITALLFRFLRSEVA
jgi:multiple sugar transport system permease protein